MVLHDYRCNSCGYEFEHLGALNDMPLCKECRGDTKRIYKGSCPIHIFKEGFFEHLDRHPVYVKSKKQLRKECDKRGVTSHYLD